MLGSNKMMPPPPSSSLASSVPASSSGAGVVGGGLVIGDSTPMATRNFNPTSVGSRGILSGAGGIRLSTNNSAASLLIKSAQQMRTTALPRSAGSTISNNNNNNADLFKDKTKFNHVLVNAGVLVDVSRTQGEAIAHIISCSDGSVNLGQYVLGGGLGETPNVSFYKLPETIVKRELKKFAASGSQYTLVITDSPDSALHSPVKKTRANSSSSNASVGVLRGSVLTPIPGPGATIKTNIVDFPGPSTETSLPLMIVENDENVKQSDLAQNNFLTQDDDFVNQKNQHSFGPGTPIPNNNHNDIHSQTSVATTANVPSYSFMTPTLSSTTNTNSRLPRTESLQSLDPDASLHQMRQSVDRMRMQRAAVERVRRESDMKSVKIAEMQTQILDLTKQVDRLHLIEAEHGRIKSALILAEEKADHAEKARVSAETALENARREQNNSVLSMRTQLAEERKQLEESNRDIQTKLSDMEIRARLAEEKLQASSMESAQFRAELASARDRAERAEAHLKKLEGSREEQILSIQRDLTREKLSGAQAREQAQRYHAGMDEAENRCRNLQIALDSSKERSAGYEKTISKLEQENASLRSQLSELDLRSRENIHNLDEQLKSSRLRIREEALKVQERSEASQKAITRAEEAERALAHLKEEYMKMSATAEQRNNAWLRSNKEKEAIQHQLNEQSAKLDAMHQRLLDTISRNHQLEEELELERNSAREWARARLDLLSQFCEEEQLLEGVLRSSTTTTTTTAAMLSGGMNDDDHHSYYDNNNMNDMKSLQ